MVTENIIFLWVQDLISFYAGKLVLALTSELTVLIARVDEP